MRGKKLTVDILVTSRNGDRTIMQSITTSRPPSRKRKSSFYLSTFVYSRFFPKTEFFLLFARKWILRCPSPINTREYYGLVIKYTISHHPNLCIKVGNTPLSLPLWWGILFFCNHTWQGQSFMVSLKLLLLKKTLRPPFMDGVQLLFFNSRSLGLPGAHLVDLTKKNGWFDLGATQLFSTQDAWIGNPAP